MRPRSDSEQTRAIDSNPPTRGSARLATRVAFLASVASVVLSAGPAAAQLEPDCDEAPLPARCRSYAFTARVTTVSDPGQLFELLAVGEVLTGTVTLDAEEEDLDVSSANAHFPNAVECAKVNFPSGRRLEVENEAQPPLGERFVEVQNDRVQALGGGLQLVSDGVTATAGGPSEIRGGVIPPDQLIAGMATFGYGYAQGCLLGFQTPCPPEVVTNDSFPGPPGNTTTLDSALLQLQFERLAPTANSIVFADLESMTATQPVQCPEPSFAIGLATAIASLAARGDRRRLGRASTR